MKTNRCSSKATVLSNRLRDETRGNWEIEIDETATRDEWEIIEWQLGDRDLQTSNPSVTTIAQFSSCQLQHSIATVPCQVVTLLSARTTTALIIDW